MKFTIAPLPPVFRHRCSVWMALLLLPLGGCQPYRVLLTPRQIEIAGQLDAIRPASDPLPAETPVIDVHTHTFNARYLPLEGILLGKRDAKVPFTTLISDASARAIARALVDETELASVPGQSGVRHLPGPTDGSAPPPEGWVQRLFADLIRYARTEGAWERGDSLTNRMAAIRRAVNRMGPLDRLAIRSAASMMGMDEHVSGSVMGADALGPVETFTRFVWILTLSDADLPVLYRQMHAGVPVRGEITMISHMMDLAPVYNQVPDGQYLLDFPTQQVARMQYFQKRAGPGMHYFVAYNPYRDNNTNCGPWDSLAVVRHAITNGGAIGVKVYPPSGYRPAANAIKDPPCAPGTPHPGRQWEARYGSLGTNRNQVMDARLNELLEWCIAHDVPVFAHSGYGEFEARKGYGEYHAHPKFWGDFLASHSTSNRPCTLRLCLGHAGGDDYWMGGGKREDWGRAAYELCTKYPNVYCEITTGGELLERTRRAYFVDRLATLFAESDALARNATPDNPRFRFAEKLLYGTDWFLPDSGEPAAVLRATQLAFLHPNLRCHFGDYFSGNARRYLRLDSGQPPDHSPTQKSPESPRK